LKLGFWKKTAFHLPKEIARAMEEVTLIDKVVEIL